MSGELIFFAGSIEEPSRPDQQRVLELWRAGDSAIEIAGKMGCKFEFVVELLSAHDPKISAKASNL